MSEYGGSNRWVDRWASSDVAVQSDAWLAVADAVYEWLAVADAALAGYRVIWAGATFDDEERGQLVIVKRYATIL